MQELAEIGVQENKLIKTLTLQTTRETKFMSTIALISAIFLPATFLAVSQSPSTMLCGTDALKKTIFGMNFFDFEDDNIKIPKSFWIYVLVAGSLSGLTVLFWYYWQRRVQSRSVHENDEFDPEK